jgi:hypothetical protein
MKRRRVKTAESGDLAFWRVALDERRPLEERRAAFALLVKARVQGRATRNTEAALATRGPKPAAAEKPPSERARRVKKERAAVTTEAIGADAAQAASALAPAPARVRAPRKKREPAAPIAETTVPVPPRAVAPVIRKRAEVEAQREEATAAEAAATTPDEGSFDAMLREAREKADRLSRV